MNFKNWIFGPTAKCQETPEVEEREEVAEIEEVEVIEEQMNQRGGTFIPPYRMLLQGLKSMTMNTPMSEIDGFKLNVGLPLSPNFMVGNEIQMIPPKPKKQGGFNMMDMMGGKTPFYTLNLQYHHGEFTQTSQKHYFSLVGKVDSNGKLDAIFFKNFNKWNMRLHFAFMNSNMQFSNTSLEFERKDKYSKQTFTYTPQALEYTIMNKLGKKLAVGMEATYIKQKGKIGVGFATRYMRNMKEKYYLNWSESMQSTILGSIMRLDNNSSLATELEFQGENAASMFSLGYKRKVKNFEVNSAIKSNGEIKSLFSYNNLNMYKLKLFLAGNVFQENFKSGYAFTIGQSED